MNSHVDYIGRPIVVGTWVVWTGQSCSLYKGKVSKLTPQMVKLDVNNGSYTYEVMRYPTELLCIPPQD